MRKTITVITVITAIILCIAFLKTNDTTQIRGITDEGATAIVWDHNLKLRDFVTITQRMDTDRIEFLAPDSGEEFFVCAVGPNVHKDLPHNIVISSKKAEGFNGRVTVKVERGIITAILGNTIDYRPVPDAVLRQVAKEKRVENRQRPSSTIIVAEDRFISKLVQDNDGNMIPNNLAEKEQAFLDIVIPAIKSKNLQALSGLIHRNADDDGSFSPVRVHLENFLKLDMQSYQFTRVDTEHPDNKELIEEHNSLPVRWLLTIKYKNPNFVTHGTLKIGEQDGRLLLPTTYSKSNP